MVSQQSPVNSEKENTTKTPKMAHTEILVKRDARCREGETSCRRQEESSAVRRRPATATGSATLASSITVDAFVEEDLKRGSTKFS